MAKGKQKFDLEERTFEFALQVRAFVKKLPRTLANTEDAKQLVRASGSVGANYIEANNDLGKKDNRLHLKISRKEAKECRFFLRLLDTRGLQELEETRKVLIKEAGELTNILSAILGKKSI